MIASPDLNIDYSPWTFWATASEAQRDAQLERQHLLTGRGGVTIGKKSYISALAMVDPDTLAVGSESLVAAHAYLTGTLDIGNNCTVNAFTVVRGSVSMGDGVRIGAHTSVLGFNHSRTHPSPCSGNRSPVRASSWATTSGLAPTWWCSTASRWVRTRSWQPAPWSPRTSRSGPSWAAIQPG